MSALSDLYTVPQEHLDFREAIREIATERIAPRAAQIDEEAAYPHDLRRLLAEHDILGLPFETEHGGTGTGTLMLNVAVEEIAKACASTALILMIQELGTLPIKLFGSEELRDRFLPRCATGEWTPAFALSEPEAGSDPGGMRTRAVKDGDEWVIDGTKNWITNLGIADFYICFAVTDRDAGHSRGITAFVVEADRPGFSVGKLEHKLGIRGSPTGQPIFDGVRIPEANVIGQVGHGFRVAMGTLDRSRLGVAAQALGIAQGATDYAAAYARERRQFGEPINSFQAIQFKLADMETQCAAGRELLYQACAKVDRSDAARSASSLADNGPPLSHPADPDVGKYSAMAKLFCSDVAMKVTVEAVQVLGGYGYVKEYPVERMLRDAKITQIYEGTNEIQRLVIARTMR
ncbi:MAG: acyl-CoA dehydrogenase family protein [Solirubrobacterales bacterium]|nr:acyl-CoA dehydrogenase family protein [Solirubrobacterales bacterium]